MKKYLLVCLAFLTCASAASAQFERPLGFADILWRTKTPEVKKRMMEKAGIRFDGGSSNKLTFFGGTFAGKPADVWGLDFVDGEFYRGAVILKPVADREKEFDAMKVMLTEKYGRPTTISKKGKNVKVIWRFEPDSRNRDQEYLELWNNPREQGTKITYRNESMNTARPEEGV